MRKPSDRDGDADLLGQPVAEQNTTDQSVRILHLANGLILFPFADFVPSQCYKALARIQKVLVDRRQLVGHLSIEMFDHLWVKRMASSTWLAACRL
jgi:hypothetical protein